MHLTRHDCEKVMEGCEAAWLAGAPMTRFATLAWELGGIDPKQCLATTSQFISLARDWMRSQGHPMPWAYVQEAGQKYGMHAHALFHVPPELDPLFRTLPQRWAKHLLGGRYVKNVMRCESLRFRSAAYSNDEAHWAEVQGKVHYMLKTAPVHLEAELGMTGWSEAIWGRACLTYGKRAGAWQHRGRVK
jgi:hypothetical protein